MRDSPTALTFASRFRAWRIPTPYERSSTKRASAQSAHPPGLPGQWGHAADSRGELTRWPRSVPMRDSKSASLSDLAKSTEWRLGASKPRRSGPLRSTSWVSPTALRHRRYSTRGRPRHSRFSHRRHRADGSSERHGAAGELPSTIVWKISAVLAPSNPVTFRQLSPKAAPR
jgi:hypothetical protein